jgi:branched-chain amino acid transport system permease protein
MLPGGVFSTTYDSDLAILRTKTQWLLLGLGLALLFTAPLFASSYWLRWLTMLGITIVAILGLHILSGLCGQLSIGHSAFMGVGAYTVAILTARAGLNSWLCLPICGLSAGLVGLVFGLPCFRLKGLYLAISTLAASFIIIWSIQHLPSMTGGFMGLSLDPLNLGPIDVGSRAAFYVVTMVIMVLATVFAKNIQRTATGRAFMAIRDNELAAEVSGIPVFRYKMLAFFIGCVFAGVAGWLWAYYNLRVNPNQFGLYDSMWYVGMLIVGGWGSTSGVFFGAVFLRLVGVAIDQASPYLADSFPSLAQQIYVSLGLILSGLIVVLFMMLEPRGLYYLWEKFKAYYRLHPYAYWGSQD